MKLKQRLEIFKEDIFDERLKTHKLKGNLNDYYAFSISYSDRIVFKLLDDGGIYLIEIGSHEICY
jgi:mRNA-degrading endonuclease YafQ of YafQ-DinJ toxin-antitoxin module